MCITEFYKNIYFKEMLENGITLDQVKNFLPLLCSPLLNERLNYDNSVHRIGYTFIFCAYCTRVVEYFISKAVTECLEVKLELENLIDASGVWLCSIGGGPGADIVGALLAFTNFTKMLKSVTILEECGSWRKTFNILARCLKIGCLRRIPGNVINKRVKQTLIEVRFLLPISKVTIEEINCSNIFLMVECSTMFPEVTIQLAMQIIMGIIKPGALIFFVDSSSKFAKMIETKWFDFGSILYGPVQILYNLPSYERQGVEKLIGYDSLVSGARYCMVLQKKGQAT